jgi:hypothetical protein
VIHATYSAPFGQDVVSSHATGLGSGGVGGAGGDGGLGVGAGGLGPVLTGMDGCMAMPHCPGLAPAVPRLRTSLENGKNGFSTPFLVRNDIATVALRSRQLCEPADCWLYEKWQGCRSCATS